MNKIVPFFILIFIAPCSGAADISLGGQKCQQSLNAGEFSQAISQANAALKVLPEDRDAILCLGRAQGGAGHHDAAVAAFQTADKLSKSPLEHAIAQMHLGNQYRSVKDFPDALGSYKQSLAMAHVEKVNRYEMIAYNLIGETLQESGDFSGAIDAANHGLKLAANDNERADSYAHLAAAYNAKGEHDQAIGYQLKSVVLEERSGDLDHYAHASLQLGLIYLEAGQFSETDKVLGKLLPVVTQAGDGYWEASIYEMQGRVRYAQGKGEEGTDLFRRAVELARKIGAEELAKEFEEMGAKNKM